MNFCLDFLYYRGQHPCEKLLERIVRNVVPRLSTGKKIRSVGNEVRPIIGLTPYKRYIQERIERHPLISG
jgi:hypothetical protein